MAARADVAIFGTGNFAARILFDLAATAVMPLRVVIIGRNADRLSWLRTGASARAVMFGKEVELSTGQLPAFEAEPVAAILATLSPRVVLNTASVQGGRKDNHQPDAWTEIIREAGLGVTAVLQARISLDIARAVTAAAPGAFFINCCYPDVVNPMLAAAGLPVTSGIGNVAILAHAFAGALRPQRPMLQMLAQHAALSAFRRPAAERTGPAPLRVWLEGTEIEDPFARFARVKLAPEPVIDVSGASGIPFVQALIAEQEWSGHLPGPNGLPGGYPVRLSSGVLKLALPSSLSAQEAIAWNQAFEERNGVVVAHGRVRYTGALHQALSRVSRDLAAGFAMNEYEDAFRSLSDARSRRSTPSATLESG